MNERVRNYWRELRALEATLPDFVWLVGGEAPDVVMQVAAPVASKFLRAKSHRLASETEVAAHLAREAQSKRDARLERMRRSGAALVVTPALESDPGPAPKPRRRR